MYAAPEQPSRQGVNELTRVRDAPALVTDGIFLPDGKRIALLTYGSVVIVDAKTYETLATAAGRSPGRSRPSRSAVSLDGETLLVGSEGTQLEGLLDRRTRRVVGATEPERPAQCDAEPDRECQLRRAERAADDDAELIDPEDVPEADPEASDPQGDGTLLAVGLAAVVAVVAGLVVVFARRPGG